MKFTKIILAVLLVLTLLYTYISVNNYVIDLPKKTPKPTKTVEIVARNKYENKLYSISYPELWNLLELNDYGVVIQPDREVRVIMNVNANKTAYPEYTDEEKLNEKIANLKMIVSYGEFKETADVFISGRLFKIVEYTTEKDEVKFINKVYFTVNGQYEYEIYYYCNEIEYEEYSIDLNDIVISFEIKE